MNDYYKKYGRFFLDHLIDCLNCCDHEKIMCDRCVGEIELEIRPITWDFSNTIPGNPLLLRASLDEAIRQLRDLT